MVKKGDTLIEVTLAVGIFSMIAIAITSVMSGGTSSAQTALETTLAREEIDTQAEALRFIHSSYIADKDSSNQKYANLWQAITDRAYTIISPNNTEADKGILQFTPKTCKELYDSSSQNTIFTQNAFIINTRKLSSFTSPNEVLISANNNKDIFTQAITYPRIVYKVDDQNNLLDNAIETKVIKAEGIYIVAVKEAETGSSTNIVTDNKEVANKSAFYDFYIRTCWYGSDANLPSTISTVIRLYNPDVVTTK